MGACPIIGQFEECLVLCQEVNGNNSCYVRSLSCCVKESAMLARKAQKEGHF